MPAGPSSDIDLTTRLIHGILIIRIASWTHADYELTLWFVHEFPDETVNGPIPETCSERMGRTDALRVAF
jgi:hypothetical protein